MRLMVVFCAGLLACQSAATPGEWAEVTRGDLVVEVELMGTIEAVHTSALGTPALQNTWEFKLTFMSDEGKPVAKGDPVLRFDTSDLQKNLIEKRSAMAAAMEELAKKRHELTLANEAQTLAMAEAEARFGKAELKARVPEDLAGFVQVRTARLDAQIAAAELESARSKTAALERQARAELQLLQQQVDLARRRVQRLEADIAACTLVAPRAGTVIYKSNWRGEKMKVGDSVWRGQTVVEVAQMDEMRARAVIDEVDAGKVALGQRGTLRLEAHPDDSHAGTVVRIAETVQAESWNNPRKVMRLDLKLDRSDPLRMSPGMRFRGQLEVARVANAIMVPVGAVFDGEEGPMVWRQTPGGSRQQSVTVGTRSRRYMQITAGLAPGDRVLDTGVDRVATGAGS